MALTLEQKTDWDTYVNELVASGVTSYGTVIKKAIKLLNSIIDNTEYTALSDMVVHYDSLDYLEYKLNERA
jgi:hypothetical protein